MKIGKRKCLNIIIWISLIQGFITDYFNLGAINYCCDFLILFCLLIKITNRGAFIRRNNSRDMLLINITIVAFALTIILGWAINGASFIRALWGCRNYGRFFIFYYLCIETFSDYDYSKITDSLIKLFPVHFLIILFQMAVEHLSYDYLGGIFGKYQGCASGLMIFYGLIIIILFAKYDNKEISLKKMALFLTIILGTAAIAELKALFLYFIVILLVYSLLSRNKIKASIVLIFGVLIFLVSIEVLIRTFPEFSNFFTIETIINQLTNKEASYTYREGLDIGRSSIFYKLDPVIKQWGGEAARWLGLGLGNGEYSSSFSFLNSSFYNTYPRSNYVNFSLSFLFVETGYIGTFVYLAFFVVNEVVAIRHYIDDKKSETLLGVFIPIMCFFLVYYNCSLRTNFAYIVFALLAIIPSYGKRKKELDIWPE